MNKSLLTFALSSALSINCFAANILVEEIMSGPTVEGAPAEIQKMFETSAIKLKHKVVTSQGKAQYSLRPTVNRVENHYVVSAELSSEGKTVRSNEAKSTSLEDLKPTIESVVTTLLKDIPSKSTSKSKKKK